jgi:hypothetical protein
MLPKTSFFQLNVISSVILSYFYSLHNDNEILIIKNCYFIYNVNIDDFDTRIIILMYMNPYS